MCAVRTLAHAPVLNGVPVEKAQDRAWATVCVPSCEYTRELSMANGKKALGYF